MQEFMKLSGIQKDYELQKQKSLSRFWKTDLKN